jgi:flagellar assembly protein FliH
MGRGVISNREYQHSEQEYLVDNLPWQEELKRRAEEQSQKRLMESLPQTGEVSEIFPLDFSSVQNMNSSMTLPVIEAKPTSEELLKKTDEEAQAMARAIELEAKKKAFEIDEQARLEASEILRQAKDRAEKEVQELKEEARQTGKKEGFDKGYLDGLEKGKTEGLESYSALIQKWNELLSQTVLERKKLLLEMQPLLVELVGQALHKCLKKMAELNKQMVVDFVEETLKKAHDRAHLSIHLNPLDVEAVAAQKERLQLSVGVGELGIVPDGRIEQGGCLLETEAESVDARLSTIISQVKGTLSHEG